MEEASRKQEDEEENSVWRQRREINVNSVEDGSNPGEEGDRL